jgi:aminoglycoside phosphotransferase (APT) family kinase protein
VEKVGSELDQASESQPRVEGIDAGPVTEWFVAHAPTVQPPLQFELITGGHSNLTFRVTDQAGTRWVLRRPPLAQVLATAHDMSREHRIISALAPTDVPVAPTIGICDDDSVNGAPFYVMDFVDGIVVRDANVAGELTPEVRRRASESLVDVLARIHAVDLDAVGLADLGRHEGYIERQLKRWYRQFEASKTRELPELEAVYEDLKAAVPEQGPATIVHGDYRLDNCMVGGAGDVRAVLDWELCTLGDPLADLGLLMVYWTDPDDASPAGVSGATVLDGFLRRNELRARYEEASGRDLRAIEYYEAFGYWKLACIVEGVYARYKGGAMGNRGASNDYDFFGEQVVSLVGRARGALSRVG